MRLKPATLLFIGAAGIAGYFLWRRYQDQQRAASHPIQAPNPADFIAPIRIDPQLVPGTPISL